MIIPIAVALTILALGFVLFVREKDIPEPLPVSPTQHLEDRKQAIYDNLRDLQFEYRLGKLSDEDYQSTKQALQKELAGVLAEMEAVLAQLGPTRVPAKSASGKGRAPVRVKPRSVTVCPFCGAEFAQALKYCGECGKAIA
ncbi:MAG TPA: hypothetical protein VH351_13165 [Bryobacteraceae bacterium]|jgi:hypothetical protein|nr:hypothetical protein [Bryobacteraceae bacterium]